MKDGIWYTLAHNGPHVGLLTDKRGPIDSESSIY
jgi:hypothetical protein